MTDEFSEAGLDPTALADPEDETVDPASERDAGVGETDAGEGTVGGAAPSAPADLRDPESAPADPASPAGELEGLRQELNGLRAELQNLRRAQSECAEFAALYPDVPLSDLPDAVWEDVGRGVPVSAAYALFRRREEYAGRIAGQVNEQNRTRSSGALAQSRSGFLSPAEVRAMSPAEVRKNYQSILHSMQKWN